MNRILLAAALAVLALGTGCPKNQGAGDSTGTLELKTDDEKTLYALGLSLGQRVGVFKLSPAELKLVLAGFQDAVSNKKALVELQQFGPKIGELARNRQKAAAEATAGPEKEKAKAFLASAEKEPGATKLPSGLVYKTLKPGEGPSPNATDTVKVHYTGKLTDNTVFDSSVERGQPAEFPLNHVIPCWTEGVQKMKVGEKAQLVCPSAIAYGDTGSPPKIPGGATLVFEVELLEIKAAAAPAAPTAAPPSH